MTKRFANAVFVAAAAGCLTVVVMQHAEATSPGAQRYALIQKLASEIARAATDLGIAPEDRIVWRYKSIGYTNERERQVALRGTTKRFNDPNVMFRELNVALEAELSIVRDGHTFVMPERGEFETTAAFQDRVAAMRVEHQRQSENQRQNAVSQWSQSREKIFHDHLGNPYIENLTYRVERQLFFFQIRSGAAQYYSINAQLEVPSSEAAAVKRDLENNSRSA